MKQINGEPRVEFSILIHFQMDLDQAETILRRPAEADRLYALLDSVRDGVAEIANPVLYDHDLQAFEAGFGRCLAERRKAELRLLTNPEPKKD
jgi:hypothetical protein